MDDKYNDYLIDPQGMLSKGQVFFAQRWRELLDNATHDNHHVNCLNLHIALVELYSLCKSILEKDTYVWHLKGTIDETREILKKDPVIQQYAPQYYNILLRCLGNNSTQTKEIYKLSLQLNYSIKHIESRYIKWLITQLNQELTGTDFEKIDLLTNSLISELIHRGWSSHTLYTLVNKDEFYREGYWRALLADLLRKREPHVCLLKITQAISEEFLRACTLVGINIIKGEEAVNRYMIQGLSTNISPDSYYFIEEVQAYEWNSALDQYMEHFVRKEDMLRFYGYRSPNVANNCLIICINKSKFHPGMKLLQFKSVLSPVRLEKPLELAKKLTGEPMNLMQRVYRHCRQAEESRSAESCFLNIWVALESFTKTDEYNEKESDFVRICDNVSSSVAMGYVFNLIRYFLSDCRRCNVNLEGIINQSGNTYEDTMKLVNILTDSVRSNQLKVECDLKNTLLGYRCQQLIDLIQTPTKVSTKIKNHSQRVRWHLQRIYRVRNSIVHSASHKNQNLKLLIRHLNSYLKATVNGAIYYLGKMDAQDFDEIFIVIKHNLEATTDLLTDNNISQNKQMYHRIMVDGALFT